MFCCSTKQFYPILSVVFGFYQNANLLTVLEQHGWTKEQVDEYVLHQANAIMLQFITRKMGVPAAKVPVVMQETGNTGPASIPLAIAVRGAAQPRTVLCGFGVGLTWGAVALDLGATQVLQPVDA